MLQRQALELPLPASEKVIEGQAEHTLLCVAPTVKENVPASHSMHLLDPLSSLYLPASHDVQAGADPVYPAMHRQVEAPD
jgi:hypothetical protein